MRKVLLSLILIFLPIYILLFIVEFYSFNKSFYLNSYEKNKVVKASKKSMEELEEVTENLLLYLKDKGGEELLTPYFNQREVAHMEDVKVLFKKGYRVKYFSLVIVLLILFIFFKNRSWSLARKVYKGIFVWWGLILLLFFLTLINFNKYFTYFHLIFFDNDLWLLDPRTDLLIQMLPEQFFISIFQRIVLFFILSLAIIQIITYILARKDGKNNGNFI